MKTKSIIKAEEKLNRFNHIEFNFKSDSIQNYINNKYPIIFSHIDSDYKNYHNEIEVMLIQNITKEEAFELSELIKHTYQLETYYCNYSKHLEITLYQHLS
jgi:hypothetical protein